MNERQLEILDIITESPLLTSYAIAQKMNLRTTQVINSLKPFVKNGIVKVNNGEGRKLYEISDAASEELLDNYAESMADIILDMMEIDEGLAAAGIMQILELALSKIEMENS
tara:strand:+ start:76 stop:411 length:336 start_codon:yes stop_codon:yes gene_type:complete